jgi:hypothetical protein
VPNLNDFGKYFLANGFRLPNARGTFPIAVKTELQYNSGGGGDQDDQPAGPLPKLIVNEVELLSAASIGNNTSYYLEDYAVDGGEPGKPRDMWVNFTEPETAGNPLGNAANEKIGEFTLPLPVDPETQRPTLSDYLIFSQTVGANPFNFFNDRIGTDLSFSNDLKGLDAHLVFSAAYDRNSGYAMNGVDVMGTISQSLGDTGITLAAYRYQGQRPLGPDQDRFYRTGYSINYEQGKVVVNSLIQNGYDSSADGYGLGALSSGGFVQTGYLFSSAVALYARYDNIYDPFNLRQTQDTLSLVMRPARRVRFTVEGTRANGINQIGYGLLFAY